MSNNTPILETETQKIPEMRNIKDNGCSFFPYCAEKDGKMIINPACMNPLHYFDKLKSICQALDIRRTRYAEFRKAELKAECKAASELKTPEPAAASEQKRNSAVAHIYIEIFSNFEKDPLTDKQIADRITAFAGARPTNRNISSYRCNFNLGKIKGQDKAPNVKVERKRK